jgi:hypothetical protein
MGTGIALGKWAGGAVCVYMRVCALVHARGIDPARSAAGKEEEERVVGEDEPAACLACLLAPSRVTPPVTSGSLSAPY